MTAFLEHVEGVVHIGGIPANHKFSGNGTWMDS
jgi:hypothetical protein